MLVVEKSFSLCFGNVDKLNDDSILLLFPPRCVHKMGIMLGIPPILRP